MGDPLGPSSSENSPLDLESEQSDPLVPLVWDDQVYLPYQWNTMSHGTTTLPVFLVLNWLGLGDSIHWHSERWVGDAWGMEV